MSTPTKRRKPNSYRSSPQAVGSLDFFFGKKKEETSPNVRDRDNVLEKAPSAEIVVERKTTQGQKLTDEELARKLQHEWDEQDKVRDQDRAKVGKISEVANYNGEGPSEDGDHKVFDLAKVSADAQDPSADYDTPVSRNQTRNDRGDGTLALQSTASAEDAVSSTISFDENPLTFDPGKCLPELRKHWATQGGGASYSLLTRCFVLVNSNQSRIKIVDTLVNFLRTIIEGDPESLLPAVSFCILTPNGLLNSSRFGLRPTRSHPHIFHLSLAWVVPRSRKL